MVIKCSLLEATDRMLYTVYLLIFWSTVVNSDALLCHTCSDSDNLDNCQISIQCGNKQSCFTRIQTTGQTKTYTMGCTDNEKCGNIPEYAEISSFSGSPIKQCYECCGSKNCNKALCSHRKPSNCTDDESVDCATMNEMFDICNDTHDAKFVCPKFCNLCSLVDGNWADWSSWSICDVTCGHGKHTRMRTCTNPAPAHHGLDCRGNHIDTKPCVMPLCPVHGGWSDWLSWGACPVTCGIGIQKRFRKCDNPYPLRYGDHCFGDAVDVRTCAQETCYYGTWANWDNWGICSATCNGGLRKRSRSYKKKRSSLYVKACEGDSMQIQMCNKHDCPCKSLPSVQNGVLKRSIETEETTSFYVECYEGYELSNSSQAPHCDQHGEWNNIPTCTEVSCGIPIPPINGRIAFTSGIKFKANVLVECFDGFFVVGNPVLTCLVTGSWSQLPTCERIVLITACKSKPTYNSSYTNVAIKKDVKLSSDRWTDSGPRMVDGDYSSFIHTNLEEDPFAMIDLGEIYLVRSIYIVNRNTTCCASRLHDVIIQIGIDPSRLDTIFRHKPAIGVGCAILFDKPYRGRYVKILLESTEYLHIAELEVYSVI